MTKDELIDLIGKSPASHLTAQVAARIKPSVLLRTQPVELDALELGASRMGGVPDLPADVDWPRKGDAMLPFIAQVRLSDVRDADRDGLLPPRGWLCFFYDSVNQPWGFDPAHRDGWSMLYFDAPVASLRRQVSSDLPEGGAFEPCALMVEPDDTLPDSSALITEGVLEHMSDSFHAYFDFLDGQADEDGEPRHRLLGNPDVIQGEMRFSCQFAANGLSCGDPSVFEDPRAELLGRSAGDWILLLQVDSDEGPGWMWGDCGRIYCWIRSQDLAQRDFGHVWVVLECS